MNLWLSAARLRTLPLSLASILMGSFLAVSYHCFSWVIFFLCSLTTIALQVLSNFANDYGDTQNGADLVDRVGPVRTVQSGAISAKQMLRAIIYMIIVCLILGVMLLYYSLSTVSLSHFFGFLILGLLCILAAYNYTAGNKPYGYVGLGDVAVFIFFGLVGVLGSFYLYAHNYTPIIYLPAMSCGFFATGVLNINNIRDITSDGKAGKMTIPTRIGRDAAIIYHWVLLFSGMICIVAYIYFAPQVAYQWLVLLSFPLFIYNGIKVSRLINPDAMLKQLALTTLFFVLLFGLGQIL